MAKVLKKIIINGVDYNLPSGGGGGGGDLDVGSVNALVDAKLGNYDSFYSTSTGLYKLINGLSDEDEIGLTEGEDRDEIIANQTSMNKISHGWTVFDTVANSGYAITKLIGSNTALAEILESRVSAFILCNSTIAMPIVASSDTAVDAILNSSVAIDAFLSSSIAIDAVLNSQNLSASTWQELMSNSTVVNIIYNNDEYLEIVANNTNALAYFMESSVWSSVMSDYDKLNIFMENSTASSYIMQNETSANLWADAPLRTIINNNLLDTYLAKDDRAYNGIITFDIDAISLTNFKIARYGYNAVTSTWKYSVDGGAWTSISVAASSSSLSIALGSTGKHTVVVKPATFAAGWARQMGNRNSSNYWDATPTTLKFSIRNLPGLAFMSGNTTIPAYFMYYAFYGCTSLTEVKSFKMLTTASSTNTYYLYYTFGGCTNLTSMGSSILVPSTLRTASNYFMNNTFYNCNNLEKLPAGFDLSFITTVGTYFMYYTFYYNNKLTSLPTGFKLPSVGNSSYYMRYTWSYCTLLTSNAPSEPLTFVYAASYCFSNSGISTASPSAGSSIEVHRS